MCSRKQGYRYTLQISGGPKAFQPILWASWSPTPCGALETNQRKCGPLLETHEHHRLRNMFRKEELSIDRHTAVSIVHQIYGVFRDGQPMCDTFAKSTMAWKAWCDRLPAKYILWIYNVRLPRHFSKSANIRRDVMRTHTTGAHRLLRGFQPKQRVLSTHSQHGCSSLSSADMFSQHGASCRAHYLYID